MTVTEQRPAGSPVPGPQPFNHPLSSYYLLLGSTLLLLGLGLVMVLSASSIESIRIFDSAYTLAQRQAMFAVAGVALMLIASRVPTMTYRRLAWLALGISLVLLVLVLFIGREVLGQRNWIEIVGPFRIQPSEFAKLGIIIWGAHVLANKDQIADRWPRLVASVLGMGGLFVALVVLEGDYGNAMIIAVIVAALLFIAGAPLWLFGILGIVGAAGTAVLTVMEPYRMQRITGWLSQSSDRLGDGWQLTQGKYALGTGGWWGVGLGASREKWGSLPEAHTDFIFPIIGEELGLIGTFAVLLLISGIAFAAFRMCIRSQDPFIRIASGGVGAWVVFQSITNIGAVLGILPITGVPLPLVSYGGSSLVPTLIALGMLMAFSRDEAR